MVGTNDPEVLEWVRRLKRRCELIHGRPVWSDRSPCVECLGWQMPQSDRLTGGRQ